MVAVVVVVEKQRIDKIEYSTLTMILVELGVPCLALCTTVDLLVSLRSIVTSSKSRKSTVQRYSIRRRNILTGEHVKTAGCLVLNCRFCSIILEDATKLRLNIINTFI